MRRFLALAIVVGLCGCARKVEDPLYAQHDLLSAYVTASDPTFRAGLWNASDPQSCTFDTALPTSAWPGCARWTVVNDGKLFEHYGPSAGPETADGQVVTVRGGQPGVVQVAEGPQFSFELVWTIEQSPDGAIIAARREPLTCGAPQPSEDVNAVNAPLPEPALPGAVRDAEGRCFAQDIGVLTAAQALALNEAPGTANFIWVRPGDH